MSVRLDRFVEAMPQRLRPLTDRVIRSPRHEGAIREHLQRADELPSRRIAVIAAIAAVPEAREAFDQALIEYWQEASGDPIDRLLPAEVMVGSGPHAAVYCAARAQRKKILPLVVEREMVPGGVMASCPGPAFWLNSRNRPGPLGTPGDFDSSLMALPGCELQPWHVGGGEYQTNADLAFCVRVNLALIGVPMLLGWEAINYRVSGRRMIVRSTDGSRDRELNTDRKTVATGLSSERKLSNQAGQPTAMQWLRRTVSESFPLRGLRRVAVIGAGDSAKTVIESLLGQGPAHRGSAMDWVERVDWYGQRAATCSQFRASSRSRYAGLARWFPEGERSGRIRPTPDRPAALYRSYNGVLVQGRYYDAAIVAIGYKRAVRSVTDYAEPFSARGRRVGKSYDGVRLLGPCADLEISTYERATLGSVIDLPENRDSLWRLVDLTALAACE